MASKGIRLILALAICAIAVAGREKGSQNFKRARRDTVRHWSKQWPMGKVPYEFSSSADSDTVTAFKQAIREIERVSCIRFVPRKSEYDYVRVVSGNGCYSLVGRDGGEQDLSLGDGCHRLGIVLHEIMHLLGFFHEQSRLDRDEHVQINLHNVKDDAKRQFQKYEWHEGDTLGEDYDPDSIMHYANHAFSKNGQQTIQLRRDPSKRVGQRDKLSRIDIRQLNKLYNCADSYLKGTEKIISTTNSLETVVPIEPEKAFCEDDLWATLTGECFFALFMDRCNTRHERMRRLCPHSCQFCDSPSCVDKSEYCDYFNAMGFCQTSATVKERCPLTCGFC